MKKRYETLMAIDTRGKEDNIKDIIERLEKEIASMGVTIEQTQRLEKRDLAYPHEHLKSAYFVNFVIEADPSKIDELRGKFKLDPDVALQNYLLLPSAPAAA